MHSWVPIRDLVQFFYGTGSGAQLTRVHYVKLKKLWSVNAAANHQVYTSSVHPPSHHHWHWLH